MFGQSAAHPVKADLPPKNEIWTAAVSEESNGTVRHLRGVAEIKTSEMVISADEVDYDSDTNWAYARGHVHLEHFATGDKINADRAEYNLKTEEGKFYNINGTSPAKVMTNPGVLTTTNPFYFQALWADRIKDRYILHKGFVTDCKLPKPWWVFQAPVFDIIPGDRAIIRHAVFRLQRAPILYLPFFYRPLGKNPRQSGFLTPNIGHSSRFGYMYGFGYYWAMSRSYDMTARVQYFTQRGPALTYDFRGKPNSVTDFNFRLYGVNDRGLPQGATVQKQGGLEFELTGTTEFMGFHGRLDYNYLSSYLFRQAFSYAFSTTISNQVESIAFLQRRYKLDAYTLTIAGDRNQLYESVTPVGQPQNEVILQNLPTFEFSGRDREVARGPLPLSFSFESSAAFLSRQEPVSSTAALFRSGTFSRLDVKPHVSSHFSFKGFSLDPSATFGGTEYGNSYSPVSAPCGTVGSCTGDITLANASIFRKYADFTVDLRFPSLERVFAPPAWLHLGAKVKHVIEARATYEKVAGVDEFSRIIRFDETDILSNTNQLALSLTNRLYRKDKSGNVSEFLTWRLVQARYFDPTFGGVLIAGQKNLLLATEQVTPFPFLDTARSYSPLASSLTVNPYSFLGLEWRADYDPLRRKTVDQNYYLAFRHSKYFASVSDTAVSLNPLLFPQSNQLGFGGGYGNSNGKGWNAAANAFYDLRTSRTLFSSYQISRNTDCCGFSVQIRRFNLGIRDENQYLFSFSVANIGSFGSLQRQSRLF
ncbi:MAG: LPS-assembly protein LptD [Acidobacteriaceae bacterium]|nr:LPS-assembly protein LptD [Acidobacteriaceae bacterium]